jgi:predicted aldo/keto reductase-like oxidoreductase
MPKNGDQLSILGFGCMRPPSLKDKVKDIIQIVNTLSDFSQTNKEPFGMSHR